MDQLNQEEMRLWLETVGEDGRNIFPEEKATEWTELYQYGCDIYEELEARHGHNDIDIVDARIAWFLTAPDAQLRIPRMIRTTEDLERLERHLSADSSLLVATNALQAIGDLATGCNGRVIKRYESVKIVEELFLTTRFEQIRCSALQVLARFGTADAKTFVIERMAKMTAHEIAATMSIWREDCEHWPDLEVWRRELVVALTAIAKRPASESRYINSSGCEKDCRFWTLLPLARLNATECAALLSAIVSNEARGDPELIAEAAGAHWLATGSDEFRSTLQRQSRSAASTVAKGWLKEMEISSSGRVAVTEHDPTTRFVKGTFNRDPGFRFELHYEDRVLPETYRDTRMAEIYLYAENVLQWSWPGSEPEWRYERILLSDLIVGIAGII